VAEGPKAGEYDEARLSSELERLLSESRERGWDAAYLDALQRDLDALRHDPPETAYGNLAAGLLMWVTSQWVDAEAFDAAQALLYGGDEDPRREKVFDLIRRIAAGSVSWEEFARIEKKGLIRRERPKPPSPPDDAIALRDALPVLRTMLSEASVDAERPDPRQAWIGFSAFAARPVTAAPLYVENDMCLFQWGVYDWGNGANFECDFTRQFVLHDADGDYDHMEQLSLTLLYSADDPDLVTLAPGDLWSGGDLGRWTNDVEGLAAFTAISAKPADSLRLEHSEV
jgi:hypothetical protein